MKDVTKYYEELLAEKAAVESENVDEIVQKELESVKERIRQAVVNAHKNKLAVISIKVDTCKEILGIDESEVKES